MTVSELFCGILTHFVFFFNFPPREVEIGIFSDLSRMARAVFEGTNMVNAKGSNGHYRSWCKDKNFCRKASKALVFKKNRRSSLLEIAQKVKSRSQL